MLGPKETVGRGRIVVRMFNEHFMQHGHVHNASHSPNLPLYDGNFSSVSPDFEPYIMSGWTVNSDS